MRACACGARAEKNLAVPVAEERGRFVDTSVVARPWYQRGCACGVGHGLAAADEDGEVDDALAEVENAVVEPGEEVGEEGELDEEEVAWPLYEGEGEGEG